jgi:hypothetical protein
MRGGETLRRRESVLHSFTLGTFHPEEQTVFLSFFSLSLPLEEVRETCAREKEDEFAIILSPPATPTSTSTFAHKRVRIGNKW